MFFNFFALLFLSYYQEIYVYSFELSTSFISSIKVGVQSRPLTSNIIYLKTCTFPSIFHTPTLGDVNTFKRLMWKLTFLTHLYRYKYFLFTLSSCRVCHVWKEFIILEYFSSFGDTLAACRIVYLRSYKRLTKA